MLGARTIDTSSILVVMITFELKKVILLLTTKVPLSSDFYSSLINKWQNISKEYSLPSSLCDSQLVWNNDHNTS